MGQAAGSDDHVRRDRQQAKAEVVEASRSRAVLKSVWRATRLCVYVYVCIYMYTYIHIYIYMYMALWLKLRVDLAVKIGQHSAREGHPTSGELVKL